MTRRNKEQRRKTDLLRKCGLEIESQLYSLTGKDQHNSIPAKEIRPQITATNLPVSQSFDGGTHLGRELLDFIEPSPDVRLRDALAGFLGELSREGSLTLDQLYRALQWLVVHLHRPEYDKFPCLKQPEYRLGSDKGSCRGYRRAMNVEQKEDWTTLALRLAWAMDQAGKDDKSVAASVSKLIGRKIAWQTVQGVRLGTSRSSSYTAQIAEVLGCNPAWLSTGKGDPYAAQMSLPPMAQITPASVAMARRWQALPPNLQNNMYIVLQAFEALSRE